MIIVSGGQTGVDRAALDAALALGLGHTGFCPAGRKAEDGVIPERFQLIATKSAEYWPRTQANVRQADATLVLVRSLPLTGGTEATAAYAFRRKQPLWIHQLGKLTVNLLGWLKVHCPKKLNVAGPRESKAPGIQEQAQVELETVLDNFLKSGACRPFEQMELLR